MKQNIISSLVYFLALVLFLSVSGTVFADDLILPASLTSIEAEAFMGDTSLDNVIIPSGVTAIKARTFANSSLRSITIPSSVRSVAADAFAGTDPEIYVEDINSLSGNLTGRVHLTRNSTISSSVSYADATLIVDQGATLTVTGSLEGSILQIHGTVINRGTIRITDEITTYGSGLLSIQDVNTNTELPDDSFYGGLHFSPATGVQINVRSEDKTQTVTAIGTGSHTAEITAEGERVRYCFVPAASGSYTIASILSGDTYGYLYDSSGIPIASNDDIDFSGGNRNFSITSDLTAGTVYFYEVKYYSASKTGAIDLMLNAGSALILSHPVDMSAAAGETTGFTVTATGINLTYQWQTLQPGGTAWENTTLGENTTNTLSFQAQESYNNWQFRCKVSGNGGTPAYSNTAVLHIIRDLSLGPNSAAISTGGEHIRLRFSPGISGAYTLASSGADDTKAELYDEAGTRLTWDDDSGESNNFSLSYDLTAGSVYYYEVYYYSATKTGTISMILSLYAGPNLSLGTNSVTISTGGEHVKRFFIPTVTKNYTLTSTGSIDTKAELYDAAGNKLVYSDDEGEGLNFLISYNLAAYTVYYYEIFLYSSEKTGDISLILSETEPAEITSHPADVSASANDTVSFRVTASGTGLTYQWQRLLPGGTEWENTTLNGNASSTLSFQALETHDNWQFRCKVTGSDGTQVYSNAAVLHLIRSLSPGVNSVTISAGGEHVRLRFTPSFSGSYTLTSTGSDDTRADLYDANGNKITGDDDSGEGQNFLISYSFTANTDYYYEIYYYSASKTGTISVTLSIDLGPSLTLGENSVTISTGGEHARRGFIPSVSGSYTLTSTGSYDTKADLYDANGNKITGDDDSGEGQNFLISYSLTANTSYFYEIYFYNGSRTGTITMMLSADFGPRITQQPSTLTVNSGAAAAFSVTATGTGTLSYQWQEKADGSSVWQNSSKGGNQTDRLSFSALSSYNLMRFRCVVTDGNGFSVTSNEVTLNVQSYSDPVYRALFIPEVNYEGDRARPGHLASVDILSNMLRTITGPTGGQYTIYGANYEYEDASPSEILNAITAAFGGAKSNDVSLIYITGHGVDSVDGEQAGAIGTVRSTEGHQYTLPDGRYYNIPNKLFIDELAQKLKTIEGKVIIWIDTCGSGAGIYASDISSGSFEEEFDPDWFTGNVIRTFTAADEEIQEISELTGELRVSGKFYVLTSAAHKETSWGYSNGTVLAKAINAALGTSGTMPADTNPQDGTVTLRELYSHTYNYAISENQHVQVYPSNSVYELFRR